MNIVKGLFCRHEEGERAYMFNSCIVYVAKNEEEATKMAQDIEKKLSAALKGLETDGCCCVREADAEEEEDLGMIQ